MEQMVLAMVQILFCYQGVRKIINLKAQSLQQKIRLEQIFTTLNLIDKRQKLK